MAAGIGGAVGWGAVLLRGESSALPALPPAGPAHSAPRTPAASPGEEPTKSPGLEPRRQVDSSAPAIVHSAAEASPYPWTMSPAALQTLQQLERILEPGTDVRYATFVRVIDLLQALEKATGVRFRLEEERLGLRALGGYFNSSGTPATELLETLLLPKRLAWTIDADGTVRVGSAHQMRVDPAIGVRRSLAKARLLECGDQDRSEVRARRREQTRARLHGLPVVTIETETEIAEVVERIRREVGVSLALHAGSPPGAGGEPVRVTLPRRNGSLEDTLRDLAAGAGLVLRYEEGHVALLPPEDHERRRLAEARLEGAIREILDTPVEVAPGSGGRSGWIETLGAASGRKIVLSEEVWERAASLSIPSGRWTLQEAMDRISLQSGVTWRLVNGVIFVY